MKHITNRLTSDTIFFCKSSFCARTGKDTHLPQNTSRQKQLKLCGHKQGILMFGQHPCPITAHLSGKSITSKSVSQHLTLLSFPAFQQSLCGVPTSLMFIVSLAFPARPDQSTTTGREITVVYQIYCTKKVSYQF